MVTNLEELATEESVAKTTHTTMLGNGDDTYTRYCAEATRALCSGDKKTAISAYLKAYQLDSSNHAVAVVVADLLAEQGQNQQAASVYRNVVRQHVTRRDYLKALVILGKVAALCPEHINTLETTAEIHLRLMRRTRELDVITHHQGQALKVFSKLAAMHVKNEQHEQATIYLKRMLQIDPRNADVCSQLVNELKTLGKVDEALLVLLITADFLLENKDLDEADSLLSEAQQFTGGHVEVRAFAMRLNMARGQVMEGLKGLCELHREHPRNCAVIKTIARAYASFNKLGMARTWFTKAFKLDNDSKPLTQLATRFSAEGDHDSALNTLLPIARCFAAQDRLDDAILLFKPGRMVPHGPTLRVVYLLYRLGGHDQEAYECLEEYLVLCDSNDDHGGLDFLNMIQCREQPESLWAQRLEDLAGRFVGSYSQRSQSKRTEKEWDFLPNVSSWGALMVHA